MSGKQYLDELLSNLNAFAGISQDRIAAIVEYVAEIERAAALSALPIAGEGKVKQLEWDECTQERSREDPNREVVGYEAGSPVGIFYGIRIEYDGFHASSENDHLGRFDDLDDAKAAAQSDYETRILSALISSPGKDGGQEVEVGEPHADAMRVIVPDQWEPCSPAYLAAGGCCASAPRVWNAKDKNHWHPKLSAPQPASTALVERLERERDYAVRWANKAVEDVKEHNRDRIAELETALRSVEDVIFGSTLRVGSPEYFGVRKLIRDALSASQQGGESRV